MFGALTLIPIHTSRAVQTLHNDIQNHVGPASIAAASVQTSLFRCEQALIAFQTTGLPDYAVEYEREYGRLIRSLESAKLLSSRLGGEAANPFDDLRRSIENWNSLVHQRRLVDVPLAPDVLGRALVQQADVLEASFSTALNLQQTLHLQIERLQGEIVTDERRTMALAVMACVVGLAGMWRLCTLTRGAKRALKLREDVLRMVSHDLSNPLNTIQLAASMWRTTDDGKQQPFPDMILRAVKRMGRLIQDLRDSLVVESGKPLALNIQSHAVRPILEEVREAAECLAAEKSIKLRLKLPPASVAVIADRNRLLQVLFNLVDNAIKFTPRGGGIALESHSDGLHIRFAVSDTGQGIPPREMGKVFDLYWQAAATAHLGCGLGLATAKRIVEQHGGRIWVESDPGGGATFFFTIPSAGEIRKAA